MPEIKIGVNVNQTTTGGSGGSGGKPGSAPVQNADAAAKLAAAQREATKATGKAYSPEQMKISADYFKEMSKSSRLLKSYNGDLERFIRDFRNNQPSSAHGQKQFNSYMQQMGLGGASQPGGGIGGMVKQAVMGVFRATGMGGGTAGRIAGQGYHQAQEAEGGVASAGGMGMLARGAGIAALAYVGIKAVQKVGQKVGDAQDEATQYHDLRQSVGGASVDFDLLRESVRHFTDGLGISSGESAKLAKRYAESSQIFGTAAQRGIGKEVGQGAQLSRGFGLDPSAGVDFLATMRHFKASDGEKDNRKLAYLIGDAVGKTGAFSKADDVMNAIAHFTESTTRQSLQVANVEGYAGLMGALGGMKLPGMDAKGAASLMGQVQGNWANGGGEAGLNMRLGWAQKFGAGATDIGAIGDAGPWASAHSTFGKDSALYKLADGDQARQAHLLEMAKRGGSKSFYDHDVDAMKSQYGPEFLPMAMMGKYGVSDIGARSLLKAHGSNGGIGGFQQRVAGALSGTDKDPSKIGMQQMSMLAAIDQADPKELAAMKERALGLTGKDALTGKEKSALTGAKDDDTLKQVLTQINAFREVEDEGKTARQAQVNLDRKFQEFAAKAIPLTNMIQEGVYKLVDAIPFGGPSAEMRRLKAEYDASGEDVKKANKERIERGKEGFGEGLSAEDRITLDPNMSQSEKRAARAALKSEASKAPAGAVSPRKGSELSDSEKAYLAETDRLLGAAPGTSAAQIMVESGGDENAVSPRGAKGLGQIMPREQGVMEGRMGRKLTTRADQLEAHRLMMQENLKRFKTNENAQKAYNGGWDESKWGNAETSEYAGKIAAYRDKSIPDTARPAGGGQVVKFAGKLGVDVNYPDGRTEQSEASLSGFQQTSAGMSRG